MRRFMMQAHGAVRPLSFDGGAGAPPLLQSQSCPEWAGVPFELHRSRPFSHARDSGPPVGEQTLIVLVEGATELTIREGCGSRTYSCGPGSVSFHTACERPHVTRALGSGKIAAIRVSSRWCERIELDDASLPRFHPPMEADDTLRLLTAALCREVLTGASAGAMFAESLSLSLLSSAFDRLPLARSNVRESLSDTQRCRLRRYIDERLRETPVPTSSLRSAVSGIDSSRACFRCAFNRSPYQTWSSSASRVAPRYCCRSVLTGQHRHCAVVSQVGAISPFGFAGSTGHPRGAMRASVGLS